jgi:hypothetical protein
MPVDLFQQQPVCALSSLCSFLLRGKSPCRKDSVGTGAVPDALFSTQGPGWPVARTSNDEQAMAGMAVASWSIRNWCGGLGLEWGSSLASDLDTACLRQRDGSSAGVIVLIPAVYSVFLNIGNKFI